jgi:hypothetical protein
MNLLNHVSTLCASVLMTLLLIFTVSAPSVLAETTSKVTVDETPRHESPKTQELSICELYETVAVLKAKKETQIDASCACKVSDEVCGKNWRGAHKKIFRCACSLPQGCKVNTCSLSDITATTKATALCKKTSCSCIKQSEAICAEELLGQKSHPYSCDCPQD